MKNALLAAACALVLSSAAASAQSSQGNVGPGTDQNGAMNGGSTARGSGVSGGGGMGVSGTSTTGTGTTGMSGGAQHLDRNGVSRTPSSQGNVGPGTDNNQTPATR